MRALIQRKPEAGNVRASADDRAQRGFKPVEPAMDHRLA
jgi:hypothetical protein